MQVEIVPFNVAYSKDFYTLNIEWLKTYFYVEPYDEDVLSNPEKHIINKGGIIFFVLLNKQVIGTVALMPLQEEDSFELTKMAISPEHRGLKIGQKLMQYCLDYAIEHQFKRLILYSSRKLKNAIYLYKKHGFFEVPVEANCLYKRCDIKMQYPL